MVKKLNLLVWNFWQIVIYYFSSVIFKHLTLNP